MEIRSDYRYDKSNSDGRKYSIVGLWEKVLYVLNDKFVQIFDTRFSYHSSLWIFHTTHNWIYLHPEWSVILTISIFCPLSEFVEIFLRWNRNCKAGFIFFQIDITIRRPDELKILIFPSFKISFE